MQFFGCAGLVALFLISPRPAESKSTPPNPVTGTVVQMTEQELKIQSGSETYVFERRKGDSPSIETRVNRGDRVTVWFTPKEEILSLDRFQVQKRKKQEAGEAGKKPEPLLPLLDDRLFYDANGVCIEEGGEISSCAEPARAKV